MEASLPVAHVSPCTALDYASAVRCTIGDMLIYGGKEAEIAIPIE
jgi:hypothetical protein